jgi:drug/metabolite transporter (DMT)-like permease
MGPTAARLLLVVATALWGLTFIANHELLEAMPPADIVVIRFIGVSVVFLVIVGSRRALWPRFSRGDAGVILGSGLLAVGGAQLALIFGQQYLSPAMSGLVVATGPAIGALLAIVFLGERMGWQSSAGIALALAGAGMVVTLASGTGTELTVRNPWGASLVALAQVCWAGYTVLSKSIAARNHPVTAVASTVVAGTVMILPLLPGALDSLDGLSLSHWLWLTHMIFGATVVPYVIWFAALKHLTANETVVFMFLVPLFALAWSMLILGEEPSTLGLIGGAVIIVGVALTQLRPLSVKPSPIPEEIT